MELEIVNSEDKKSDETRSNKSLMEMVYIKGISTQIDEMKFPRISNLNSLLNQIGYEIKEIKVNESK